MDGVGLITEAATLEQDIWQLPTGVFLFDEKCLSQTIGSINSLFKRQYQPFQLAFSIKAQYHPMVLEAMIRNNVWFEVSSEYEFRKALEMGVQGNQIIINTPYLNHGLLELANYNKSLINADSISQLRSMAGFPNIQFQVGVRWSLSRDKEEPSRFGIEAKPENIRAVIQLCKESDLNICGIHCHIWTSHRSAASYRSRTTAMLELYSLLSNHFNIDYINVGGGFLGALPDSLASQFGDHLPTWADYAKAIGKPLTDFFGNEKANKPTLLIEPGTALVADCVQFLAEVIDVKSSSGKYYALLNASNTWLKPTGHSKNLVFDVFSRDESAAYSNCQLVGATCMEKDLIAKYDHELRIGDRLLFKNLGAYTISCAPYFIMGQPKMIELP